MGKTRAKAGATPEPTPETTTDNSGAASGRLAGRQGSATDAAGGKAAAARALKKAHDAICRKTLEDPRRALSFLLDHVPPLRGRAKSARLVSGALTDSKTLRELQCDCVIEAVLDSGERSFAFVVVEHKSAPDGMAILQLAKYAIALLERHAGGKAGRLRRPPGIIPVLLYHGKKKWRMPERLDATFGGGADAPGLRLRCVSVNLSEMPEDELGSDPAVQAAFLTMRYACGALKGRNRLDDVLAALPDDLHFAESLVVYLLNAGPDGYDKLRSAITKAQPRLGGAIMKMGRAARELRAEGYGQGRTEGLTLLLQRRFNGDLTPEMRQRIAAASMEEIDAWFDRGIDAPTIEAVFNK